MPDEPGGPTLGDCLRDGQARLRAAGCDTPDLDARLLLAEICDRRPGEVHSASGAVVSAAEADEKVPSSDPAARVRLF